MKLPRIPISTEADPLPRYAEASPEVFGAASGALARGAAQIGHQAERFGYQIAQAAAAQKRADDLIEEMKMRTEFQTGLGNEDITLKEAYDYKTHPDELDKRGRALLGASIKRAKNPEVAKRFEVEATRILGEKVISARADALKYRGSVGEAALMEDLRTSRQAIVEAPDPKRRDELWEAQKQKITKAEGALFIMPERAEKLRAEEDESVATIFARRLIQNDPERASHVLKNPEGTVYMKLGETRRQALSEAADRAWAAEIKDMDRRAEKDRLAAEKLDKKAAGVFVQRTLATFDPLSPEYGKLSSADLEAGLLEHGENLTYEQGRAIRDMRSKPYFDGGVTKPDTFQQLRLRVLMRDTTLSANAIWREAGPGRGLSNTDALKLLKEYEDTQKSDDVTQAPLYREGARQLSIRMTGVDPGAGLFGSFLAGALDEKRRALYGDTLYAFTKIARQRVQKGESLADLPALGVKMANDALGTTPTTGGAAAPKAPASSGTLAPKPQPGYLKTTP